MAWKRSIALGLAALGSLACASPPAGAPSAPPPAPLERLSIAPPAPPDTTTPIPATGTLALTVTDDAGRGRSGIALDVKGPQALRADGTLAPVDATTTSRVTSGTSGRVEKVVAAGYYGIAVVTGCQGAIDVFAGGVGSAAVAAYQVTNGALNVSWRHRYAPDRPVTYVGTGGAPTETRWTPGAAYDVVFTVVDRCAGNGPAANAEFPSWRIDASPNARIVDAGAKRADSQGSARMRVACTAESGDVTLVARDDENPKDEPVDLLRVSRLGSPSCVAS